MYDCKKVSGAADAEPDDPAEIEDRPPTDSLSPPGGEGPLDDSRREACAFKCREVFVVRCCNIKASSIQLAKSDNISPCGSAILRENAHSHATTSSIARGTASANFGADLADGGVAPIFSALPLTKATRPKIDFQFSAMHPGRQAP